MPSIVHNMAAVNREKVCTTRFRNRPRILPMQLKLGDRLVDETAEWEVAGRPYVTNQGKTAHARVRRVDQPEVTQVRTWGAHQRIEVRRA